MGNAKNVMDKKFNELLQRYLDNTASEQEKAELWQLAKEGSNPDEVLNEMIESLGDDSGEGINAQQRMKLLENILPARKRTVRIFPVKPFRMAAAAAVVAIAVAAVWVYNGRSEKMNAISQQEEVYTVSGPDYVRLADNSTVTLKNGSKLIYGKSFGTSNRDVTLVGEAFFDVAHNPSSPFKVHTGKIVTTVLGTAFNVNASDGNQITVAVTRGKVAVGDESHTYGTITPNEQIAVNTTTNNFVKTHLTSDTMLAWKDKFLIFDEVNLEEAATLINSKYGVKIKFERPQLKKCGVNAKFLNDESLSDVLDVVTAAVSVVYTIEKDGSVMISGNGCK